MCRVYSHTRATVIPVTTALTAKQVGLVYGYYIIWCTVIILFRYYYFRMSILDCYLQNSRFPLVPQDISFYFVCRIVEKQYKQKIVETSKKTKQTKSMLSI